jgi:hypothetical protein
VAARGQETANPGFNNPPTHHRKSFCKPPSLELTVPENDEQEKGKKKKANVHQPKSGSTGSRVTKKK